VRRLVPAASSSAQESSAWQIRRSVLSHFCLSSAQPHTTIRFQPSLRHAASLRLSRRTFFDHFSIQKATLLFGIVESAHPWRCQKQPRTSMIVRARGITTSGRPMKRLSHTRKRHPAANMRCLTSVSGFVSLPRIRLMILLRCSGVMRSMN